MVRIALVCVAGFAVVSAQYGQPGYPAPAQPGWPAPAPVPGGYPAFPKPPPPPGFPSPPANPYGQQANPSGGGGYPGAQPSPSPPSGNTEKTCKFHNGKTGESYDVTSLKKTPQQPFVVYGPAKPGFTMPNQPHAPLFGFNLCGGTVQCGQQMNSQTCQYPFGKNWAVAQPQQREITALEEADINYLNWKMQHAPPMAPDTKGVKIWYPPLNEANQYPGAQQGAQQSNPYGPGGFPAQQQAFPSQTGTAANPRAGFGVHVFIVCDENQKEPQMMDPPSGLDAEVRIPPRPNVPSFVFGIAAAAACPSTNSLDNVLGTGLSWGWVFIILLSCLITIYCCVGMVYKYKKLGVSGVEAVPNVEFWRDFPALVKDGMAFFVSKVRQCLAKGGGGGPNGAPSGPSYSTV